MRLQNLSKEKFDFNDAEDYPFIVHEQCTATIHFCNAQN